MPGKKMMKKTTKKKVMKPALPKAKGKGMYKKGKKKK